MQTPRSAPAAPETAIEPAAARSERCVAMLDRVADKCLAMVEALEKDGTNESADAFVKLSRAIRLALALQATLGQDPRAGAVDPYAALKTGKKARVCDLVRDVIDREIPDPEDHDTLVDALEDQLLCDHAYDDIEDLPLRDIVERLCADLQLKPDWSRWLGEGWKPNPPFYRPLCSAFRTPSRRPILGDTPDPRLLH
jgi:hypothetical protein